MRGNAFVVLAIFFAGAAPIFGQTPAAPARAPALVDDASAPLPGPAGQGIIAPLAIPESEAVLEPAAMEIIPKPQRFWFRAEYLLWGIKDSHYPPLVTTGSPSDPRPGSLDSPSTSILFGGGDLSNKDRNGGRFFAGWWFGDANTFGLEAGYFFLGNRSVGTFQNSTGATVLARPFFNANAKVQDSSLDAFPGLASGAVTVQVPSFLQGAESNLTAITFQGTALRLEALAGFRYLNLREGLHVLESVNVNTSSPMFGGDQLAVADRFDTNNNFYGGQLGGRAEFRWRRWFLGGMFKVALGDSSQAVNINGSSAINGQTIANAGLLAVASNSGRFTRDSFAVVPEIGGNLGFQFSRNVRGFVGYTFLYWTQVARPGDQVDTTVNLNQVPLSGTFGAAGGPARPGFILHSTDFYAHGVNFGLEIRF
jgi:hypothetical protein